MILIFPFLLKVNSKYLKICISSMLLFLHFHFSFFFSFFPVKYYNKIFVFSTHNSNLFSFKNLPNMSVVFFNASLRYSSQLKLCYRRILATVFSFFLNLLLLFLRSPLLFNVYVADLDKELEKRGNSLIFSTPLIFFCLSIYRKPSSSLRTTHRFSFSYFFSFFFSLHQMIQYVYVVYCVPSSSNTCLTLDQYFFFLHFYL